jgi:hypothetical protein
MSNLRAEFTKSNNSVWVTISIVGDPNIVERKATPEDQANFPREWEAFEAGQSEPDPEGTALTEIPGIGADVIRAYRFKKVRTVEELAALDDGAVKGLGILAAIDHRTHARTLLKAREADALKALLADAEPKKRARKAS